MQGEDVAGTLAVPIWLAGTAAAVFVVAILLAVKRAGGVALITSLFRVGLIAAAVLGAWLYVQQGDGERRALDDRKAALIAGSIAPASALSCLDELAGEVVEAACEKAVFASPEAVAAGVKYVTAQLALLKDGTAYAQRGNASYVAELATLRAAIELDRFGLVAHVLSEREGCTVDRCEALTRLSESDPRARQSARPCLRRAGEQIRRDLECVPFDRGCGRVSQSRSAENKRPGNGGAATARISPPNRPRKSPPKLRLPHRCRKSRRQCAIRPPQSQSCNPPRKLLWRRLRASRRCRRTGRLRCALQLRVRSHHSPDPVVASNLIGSGKDLAWLGPSMSQSIGSCVTPRSQAVLMQSGWPSGWCAKSLKQGALKVLLRYRVSTPRTRRSWMVERSRAAASLKRSIACWSSAGRAK